jgi:pyrroloquinoline quinone biosynthesis protein B
MLPPRERSHMRPAWCRTVHAHMRVRVLGSAAGGGFPQWNCNCANCNGVRAGTLRAQPRTQSSLAVSADGIAWILVDASPDILTQLRAFPDVQPARTVRDTGIVGVVLTDSQIDHTTGLLMLREGPPLHVYCTREVRDDLTGVNPLFRILDHYCGVRWQRVDPRREGFVVDGAEGLTLRALPLASKAPPYSPHRARPHEGDTLGIEITDRRTGKSLLYAPGVGSIDGRLRDALERVDCVLIDGTFWTDDELIRLDIGDKRAADMGHLPQAGEGGMIDALSAHPRPRKVLTHVNNTNPILVDDSPERARLAAAGIEIAHDAMELVL